MVSQKPLTPKPSSCKSPLQGWAGEGETKRPPSENGLINNEKDQALHEDQVDGFEVQNVSENVNTNEDNVKESKEALQSNEDVDVLENSDDTGNNEIEFNQKVESNGHVENDNREVTEQENENGDVEVETRTENPVFVTEGEELDDQSVQKDGNAVENGESEGHIINSEINGEAVQKHNDEVNK